MQLLLILLQNKKVLLAHTHTHTTSSLPDQTGVLFLLSVQKWNTQMSSNRIPFKIFFLFLFKHNWILQTSELFLCARINQHYICCKPTMHTSYSSKVYSFYHGKKKQYKMFVCVCVRTCLCTCVACVCMCPYDVLHAYLCAWVSVMEVNNYLHLKKYITNINITITGPQICKQHTITHLCE